MDESASAVPQAGVGDDSSIAGWVNDTPLPERLAVTRAEGHPAVFDGSPIAGFRQRTYGGHLLAQAVLAAAATVDGDRVTSSLHAYFLRAGTHDVPLRYLVDTVRDGRSLSVRSVSVRQGERELASVQVMLQRSVGLAEEVVYAAAPRVPEPDELPRLHERRALGLPADGINRPTRGNWTTGSRPLDIRYVDDAPQRCFWFRADDTAATDQNVHRAVMAFASDRSLLPAIAKARGELSHAGQWPVASVDHALWFHSDVLTGHWYLYVQDSPFSTATNGLARGTIFDGERRPVASVAQHGLIYA